MFVGALTGLKTRFTAAGAIRSKQRTAAESQNTNDDSSTNRSSLQCHAGQLATFDEIEEALQQGLVVHGLSLRDKIY